MRQDSSRYISIPGEGGPGDGSDAGAKPLSRSFCGQLGVSGRRAEAVEVIALCADAFGEVPGVSLLFEPVVNDGLARGLPMLETIGDPVEAGSVEGDLLVERVIMGRRGLPTAVGRRSPVRPHPSFFSSCMAVPPTGAMIGGPLGLFPCLPGLGEVPDRSTRLGGLPDTAAGLQVGPSLLGLGQSGFGLAQGGGPIRQADADDGVPCDGGLGVQEGGQAGLLVGRKSLQALPGEGGRVGQGGVDSPGGGALGGPVPAQVVDGLGQIVGDGPHVGGLAGPGHGHVGEFPASAVGEEVGPLGGRPLATMNGGGIPVPEAVRSCFVLPSCTCWPSSVRNVSVFFDDRRRR